MNNFDDKVKFKLEEKKLWKLLKEQMIYIQVAKIII